MKVSNLSPKQLGSLVSAQYLEWLQSADGFDLVNAITQDRIGVKISFTEEHENSESKILSTEIISMYEIFGEKRATSSKLNFYEYLPHCFLIDLHDAEYCLERMIDKLEITELFKPEEEDENYDDSDDCLCERVRRFDQIIIDNPAIWSKVRLLLISRIRSENFMWIGKSLSLWFKETNKI
ncbi:MAG: hypothetical protein EOP14_03190 [Pseudomonas sp.]|nr:MAG: hypothetical protein EOP14_03190 [Pseudomonas sp.]